MMKKIFAVVAIILGIGVIALVIFVATFDADRYRPLVVNQLERALGKPMTLEHLSLGWHNGVVLKVQSLRIAADEAGHEEPLLQAEEVSGVVALRPLLRKEFRVASIVVTRPRIHVVRDAQGRVNLLGLVAVAAPAAAPSHSTKAETPLSFEIASFRIEDGAVHWTDATTSPPTDLWLKALDVTISNIVLGEAMDLDAAGALAAELQNMQVRGRMTLPSATQAGAIEQLTLAIHALPLEQILPPVSAGQPALQGRLSADIQGRLPTLDPVQATRQLDASGTLKLTQARVLNLNILREVFAKFSMIPGLVQKLQAELPPTYQEKLAAKDTVLSPLEVPFQLSDGVLRFNELRVSTDTARLTGQGTVGLNGAVAIQARLGVNPTLSSAMIKSVEELRALTNTQGELEFPVSIQGRAPQVAVLPDLNYLASKILATKATDFLGDLLQKQFPSEMPQEESSQPQDAPPPSDPLGSLLQRAIQKALPTEEPSP